MLYSFCLIHVLVTLQLAFGKVSDLFFASEDELVVFLHDIQSTSAKIRWLTFPPLNPDNLSTCDLHYGPSADRSHLLLLPAFLPQTEIFTLGHLLVNISYYFYMTCSTVSGEIYRSNVLNFTTGPETDRELDPPNKYQTQEYLKEFNHAYFLSGDAIRTKRPSFKVIIGVVCGIVGFLIINITIVIVVRRYSQFQSRRRRRMLNLDFIWYAQLNTSN